MRFTKFRFGALVAAFAIVVPAVAVAVSPFVDVAPGKFQEAPVNWAATNGITNGKLETAHLSRTVTGSVFGWPDPESSCQARFVPAVCDYVLAGRSLHVAHQCVEFCDRRRTIGGLFQDCLGQPGVPTGVDISTGHDDVGLRTLDIAEELTEVGVIGKGPAVARHIGIGGVANSGFGFGRCR